MRKQERNMRKMFIGMVAMVYSGIVLLGTVGCNSEDAKVFKTIKEATEQINRSCPVQTDAFTKLESTEAIEPRTIRYNMVVTLPDSTDAEALKASMKTAVTNQVKNTPGTQLMRDMDVTFSYSYTTPDGKSFLDIDVTPEDYK